MVQLRGEHSNFETCTANQTASEMDEPYIIPKKYQKMTLFLPPICFGLALWMIISEIQLLMAENMSQPSLVSSPHHHPWCQPCSLSWPTSDRLRDISRSPMKYGFKGNRLMPYVEWILKSRTNQETPGLCLE